MTDKSQMSLYDRIMQSVEYASSPSHAQQIGEIVIASNNLHCSFFFWFWGLLANKKTEAKSLWETGASDSFQRQMLKNIVSMAAHPELETELLWTLKKADLLSPYRNAFVHTPMKYNSETLDYDEVNEKFAKITHANRVNEVKQKRLFDPLKSDYNNLNHYIFDVLEFHFKPDLPLALPDRPALKLALG